MVSRDHLCGWLGRTVALDGDSGHITLDGGGGSANGQSGHSGGGTHYEDMASNLK